jgi:hypothetical protein
LQTQAEFTFAAGTRASTGGGIGVLMHQHVVAARLFAMAQSFALAQSGQETSRSGMAPILWEERVASVRAAAPQCGPDQQLSEIARNIPPRGDRGHS